MKSHRFKGFHIIVPWFLTVFTFNKVIAITLFPFVIYRSKFVMAHQTTKNEETIHILQQTECGLVGISIYILISILSGSLIVGIPALFLFYILYLFFFIINLFRFPGYAYDEIPFEREAKRNSNRSVYIGLRKPFSWIRYIG
jgi:hypothetical protein